MLDFHASYKENFKTEAERFRRRMLNRAGGVLKIISVRTHIASDGYVDFIVCGSVLAMSNGWPYIFSSPDQDERH